MYDYNLIKQRRKDLNMTQSQLAKKVGVTSAYIQQLEKNVKKNPSLEIQIKLADILGINIDDLAGTEKAIYLNAMKEINYFINKYPQNKDDISKILKSIDNCLYCIYNEPNNNSHTTENIKLFLNLLETVHDFLQTDLIYPPSNDKDKYKKNSLAYINEISKILNNILINKLNNYFNEGD